MAVDMNLTGPAAVGQYPAGFLTRPVHLGGAVSVEAGVPLTVHVVTEASRALIHIASGERLEKLAHRSVSPLSGELVWWETATTDRSGEYLDAETRQAIVLGPDEHTHLYTTTLTVLSGGEQVGEYTVGPYPVPTGDRSAYDLDTNLISDGTAEGTLVAIPELWVQIIADAQAIASLKGQPDGIAELDGAGRVPLSQIPVEEIADAPEFANLVPDTRTVAGKPLSTDVTLTKSDVGLGSVDNTSDANKPISAAVLAALARLPRAVAQGRVTITPTAADTPIGVSVLFPAGRFTVAPRVQVTAESVTPGTAMKGVGYSSPSTTGATIYLTRTDLIATPVVWTATQMTATTADG